MEKIDGNVWYKKNNWPGSYFQRDIILKVLDYLKTTIKKANTFYFKKSSIQENWPNILDPKGKIYIAKFQEFPGQGENVVSSQKETLQI